MTVGCDGFLPRLTGEWAEAAADLQRQNSRERTLQRALPTKSPYRFIRPVDIQADDARLAQQYLGRVAAGRRTSRDVRLDRQLAHPLPQGRQRDWHPTAGPVYPVRYGIARTIKLDEEINLVAFDAYHSRSAS